MSTTALEDLSRVTIISPTRRVDLALPGTVTLSELLPTILRFCGQEANNPTDAVQAWVLQRLGSDPFDPYVPVSRLNLRDGEILHLRHRENAIPDAAFDDVVDAVAGATNAQPAWLAHHSRTLGITILLAAIIGVPALALLRSRHDSVPLLVSLGITFLISLATFIGSVALARAAGERHTATALAWASVATAALTGWFLPSWFVALMNDGNLPPGLVPIRLLTAAALILVASAACALAAKVHPMALFGVAVTAGLLLVGGAAMALNVGHQVWVPAIGLAFMGVLTTMLPTLSFRMAGIALPDLPSTTEAMLADETPVQADIVRRALLADRLLGALLAASCSTAVAASLGLLAMQRTWWAVALVLAVGLALLLRARAFVGLGQRAALLVGGTLCVTLGLLSVTTVALSTLGGLAVTFVALIVVGYVLAHYSAATYAKVLTPTWGRSGDVLEWVSIISIVPLLLGVLDQYTRFRSMFG